MKNTLLLLASKAGYASGYVYAESNYKESARCIISGCDSIEFTYATRETGHNDCLIVEAFKTEADFGYRIALDAFEHGIETFHVDGSNLADEIRVQIVLNNGVYYLVDAKRIYKD
jgi:phage major head subunit gpT-like protein